MGTYFVESIIQQYGYLDHKLLSVLKDFGHLMHDDKPVYQDGRYIFSVPQLKLALMGNVSYTTITRNLGKLHDLGVLVKIQREDPVAGLCGIYGLKLDVPPDSDRLRKPYFSTVFGGVRWEDALKAYNKRKGSLKKLLEEAAPQPPPVRKRRGRVVPQSRKYTPVTAQNHEADFDLVRAMIEDVCPGFDFSAVNANMMTPESCACWRTALAVFADNRERKKKQGGPIRNEGAYLMGLFEKARRGSLTRTGFADAPEPETAPEPEDTGEFDFEF